LPRYRSKFSKHQFTQPQLLALLCVMRYEDWTFRETEVRLREHRELRRAFGLRTVPHYTTLYRFLHRVDETALRTAVGVVAQQLQRGRCRGATVAIDGTGLAAGAVSPFFITMTARRCDP
jgi:transposase